MAPGTVGAATRCARIVTSAATAVALSPSSVHDVQQAMQAAIADTAPLRILGANTWINAGAPIDAQRTLSLSAVTGIVAYVPGDLTITARAGTSLAELAHATAAHGQWLGLDPAGDRHGTIGATISTASSGPLAHAFGTPRDLVLGLQVVTGYGDIVRPGGRVVKNVAGFDLVRLFTGSWGTLGAITEVTLRLRALPTHDLTLALPVADPAALSSLFMALRRGTFSLLACEWINSRVAQMLGVADGNGAILVRIGGNNAFVAGQRTALRALGPFVECSPSVWGTLSLLDIEAHAVARCSGAVTALPARLDRITKLFAEQQIEVQLHASIGRGVCRVISMENESPGVRTVLQLRAPEETMIPERLPASWWSTQPDAFASPLSTGIRNAFDPHRICNPRRVTDE